MGNFNMLPKEIMLEIFSRVPAESVVDCKSVSKTWRNLLQNPSFQQMHFNHFNDLDSGELNFIFYTIGYEEEKPIYYAEYDENLKRFNRTTRINLRPPFENYYILHSCNGLICFSAFPENYYAQPAYICNPITREYIVIPMIEGTALLTGFGYSPSTNKYKVVRIFRNEENPDYGIIQVYTLGSGIGWRNGRKMDYDVTSFFPRGVFANGAIHWWDNKGTIVSFNLADEEFRQLPSLPSLLQTGDQVPIIDLHGLGVFLCARHRNGQNFDMWVFKKNIWSKEFSNLNAKPISFTKSGGLLCYDNRGKNVYLCAAKDLSSRMLVNFGKNFDVGVPHKNSLVSLKALGEEGTKLLDSGAIARSGGEQQSSDNSPTDKKEGKDL